MEFEVPPEVAYMVCSAYAFGCPDAIVSGLGGEMVGQSIPVGNDSWYATWATRPVDGVKVGGVLLTVKKGYYAGGTGSQSWFLPFSGMKRVVLTVGAVEV